LPHLKGLLGLESTGTIPNKQSFLNLETLEGTQMKKFLNDESGAVTVDFVVLTAGAVLIAAGVGSALQTKVDAAVSGITLATSAS
jgi:Flp pilus assembly pilin Flp